MSSPLMVWNGELNHYKAVITKYTMNSNQLVCTVDHKGVNCMGRAENSVNIHILYICRGRYHSPGMLNNEKLWGKS